MNARLSLVLFLALGAVGWLAPDSASAQGAQKLFPTGAGSTWSYKGTAGSQQLSMDATITSSSTSKGVTTVVERWTMNGRPVQEETYLVTSASVSRARGSAGGATTISPAVPIIKYPMSVGKSWEWNGTLSVGSQMKMNGKATLKVVSLDKLSTPAGKFNAYRVDMKLTVSAQGQSQTIPNTYWFAPGVGLVKQSSTLNMRGQAVTIQASVAEYKIK